MQMVQHLDYALRLYQAEGTGDCGSVTAPDRPVEEGAGHAVGSQVRVPAPNLLPPLGDPSLLLQMTTDLGLAHTRAMILEKSGFHVLTMRAAETFALPALPRFAVVLFCQTVPREKAIEVSNVCRKLEQRPRTIRLTFEPQLEQQAFDAVLAAPVLPGQLALEAAYWKRSWNCQVAAQ